MENKAVLNKLKTIKKAIESTDEIVIEEVSKNDLAKNDLVETGFSLKDLKNEDELDFSLKGLTKNELDAFCHAITHWQLRTSYELPEELLDNNTTY